MTIIHSFPPICGKDPRKLILGSMPGKASLAANQYYAHLRNDFWKIMALHLNFGVDLPYENRCEEIMRNGIALWDVLKTCRRSGSLDADIVEASIIPNDLEKFLQINKGIRAIYFNGAKAEKVYRRHVLLGLSEELASIHSHRLTSTSPANAAVPFAVKLRQWQVVAPAI